MKQQAVNPYLPGWEHVPDGEPHVFGDRLYFHYTGKGAIDLRELKFE